MTFDFIDLQTKLWSACCRQPGDPERPSEMQWQMEYPTAIERAIVINDYRPLLALLDAGCPLHPMLLPALADAMRMRPRGLPRRAGVKPKLTPIEANAAALQVQMLMKGLPPLTADPAASKAGPMTQEEAVAYVAAALHVSSSVVKRAYAAKYPPALRPGRNRLQLRTSNK